MTYNVPQVELKRVEYASMRLPAKTGVSYALAPTLFIRMRPFDADLAGSNGRTVQARALLDTGATVSSVPMWSLQRMGIAIDEGAKRMVFNASSGVYAYDIKIRVEIEHNDGWFDIGVINALTPDTVWSRDPRFHLPFLLGRRGFFDKFDICISESQKALWIRRIGGWPKVNAKGSV